jgi:hypothetical protein
MATKTPDAATQLRNSASQKWFAARLGRAGAEVFLALDLSDLISSESAVEADT